MVVSQLQNKESTSDGSYFYAITSQGVLFIEE